MFILHSRKTKSELDPFESHALCGHMNVSLLLNMYINVHASLIAGTDGNFNVSL